MTNSIDMKKKAGRPPKVAVEHVPEVINEPVAQETALEVVSPVSTHELAPSALKEVMAQEAERRALITQYIGHHMKSGVDFGTIRFGNKESKPSLFKPGSEKFLSLFKLTASFEKDTDTWEMAGSEAGVFAYVCLLYSSNGAVVGEGRGVSKLSEKAGWTVNNAVKIAEKRAQIDAVLRSGALSDFFTQDLEDMAQETPKMEPYRVERKTIEERHSAYPEMTHENDAHGISEPEVKIEDEKEIIKRLVKARGKIPTPRAVHELTGLPFIETNYEKIIARLEAKDAVDGFDKVVDGV
jgi:hypothetical protein